MSAPAPSSVCIDDDRFLPLIESVLTEHNLRAEIIHFCQQAESDFRACWQWLDDRDSPCPLAETALTLAVNELSKRVSHVHAFHGCRVIPDSSYCANGILPLARGWIEAEIIKWAGILPSSGSPADRLMQNYLRSYSGKVCAVKSLRVHQENGGYGHALGSETLRSILRLHDPKALNRFLQTGEPSIIEFLIPVPALEVRVWQNFVSDMLRIWLSQQFDFVRPGSDPSLGGLVFSRKVPHEWLVRSYLCDDRGKLTGRVCSYSSED